MAVKNVTINLVDFRKAPPLYHEPRTGYFQIEKMVNTIEYQAGAWLKDDEVNQLIRSGAKVNIRMPKNADYS